MRTDRTWIDTEYTFKGLWEVESRCGLKVIERGEDRVFVVTELFNENPGTSVTNACALLATDLRAKHGVDPERFVFVEHCPDRGSRLDFQQETFDIVTFEWDGGRFVHPKWERIPPDRIGEVVGEYPE